MASATDGRKTTPEGSLIGLVRAGLELGVAEASRKVSESAPKVGKSLKDVTGTGLVWSAALTREMGKALREDPDSVVQIVKEVWSRGGPKEKKVAAEALGTGLGRVIPYKAVTAARELARMARSSKEAEMVGQSVLEPIMERNPAIVDRVKTFLQENEVYVQRAAIAALVALASRRKKYVGVAVQGLLILAETKEVEFRKAVRAGIRTIAQSNPQEAAKTVVAWAKSDPTRERLAIATETLKAAPAKAKERVEMIIFGGLERLANGSGSKKKTTGSGSKKKTTGSGSKKKTSGSGSKKKTNGSAPKKKTTRPKGAGRGGS